MACHGVPYLAAKRTWSELQYDLLPQTTKKAVAPNVAHKIVINLALFIICPAFVPFVLLAAVLQATTNYY